MGCITSDQCFYIPCNSHFKKWFVILIRQGISKGCPRNKPAIIFYKFKKGSDVVLIEAKFWTLKNISIFGKNPGIQKQCQFT